MKKEDFIKLLQRSSPNEIRDFICREGKKKLISPFIFEEGYEDNQMYKGKGKSN